MSSHEHTEDNKPARNKAFQQAHEPFKDDASLQLDPNRVIGPFSFLSPTAAHFQHEELPDVRFKWTSRNNRKGRHAIVVPRNPSSSPETKRNTPQSTTSFRGIMRGIWRMCTYFPYWDISWNIAIVFTIGSVVWVINAFFAWLPLVRPETEFKTETLYGGGITAFIGATIFEVGSFMLMVEAINENRTGCFGWALERAFSQGEDNMENTVLCTSKGNCSHHHQNKKNFVGKGVINPTKNEGNADGRSWEWWPSNEELRTHFLRSLGYLACLFQLLGASIFWVSGLTALPGIFNHMSRPIEIVFYWTAQVVGGSGFVISGVLFMLENQEKWWKPALGSIGWWVGTWNLIGGLGFTLCPAFGYDESSWASYQSSLSTFWGSWAFLIGSLLLWYESLDKFPVELEKMDKHDDADEKQGATK